MKKYIISMLLLLAVLLRSVYANEMEVSYSDVQENAWFAPAVAEMTRLGFMSGVGNGRFEPYAEVTRAAVVTVLWRMEGAPELPPEIADGFTPFPDTEDWYYMAAAWAKYVGIATGYAGEDGAHSAGTFGGRDPVTREQLAVFLYRYIQQKGEATAQGILGLYRDAQEIAPWAMTAVRHAIGMGILQGNAENCLEPKGIANRASLAVMLSRMLAPAKG